MKTIFSWNFTGFHTPILELLERPLRQLYHWYLYSSGTFWWNVICWMHSFHLHIDLITYSCWLIRSPSWSQVVPIELYFLDCRCVFWHWLDGCIKLINLRFHIYPKVEVAWNRMHRTFQNTIFWNSSPFTCSVYLIIPTKWFMPCERHRILRFKFAAFPPFFLGESGYLAWQKVEAYN